MLKLRDYQQELIHLAFARIREGKRRVVIVGSTGMGKRIIAVWLANQAVKQGKRVVIVTDRRQLVFQMMAELLENDAAAGVVMGTERRNHLAPIQVCSIQTLARRHFVGKDGITNTTGRGFPPADLLIIDEAHKESKNYARLLQYYPRAIVLGLTATPVDSMGRAIWGNGQLYESWVEGARNSILIDKGWLLPTHVLAPSEPDIRGVHISKGEFNQTELGEAVERCTLFANIWDEWEPFSHMKTIVFAPSVAYCNGLARDFERRLGPGRAFVVTAKTPQAAREQIFDAMAHEGRVLVSVDVLREGFDLPAAQCLIDLQPSNRLRTAWQKWGRVKRPYEGQSEAVLIDLAGNYWRHIHPDEDPSWDDLMAGESIEKLLHKKRANGEAPEPICCPSCKSVLRVIVEGMSCPYCGHLFRTIKKVRYIRNGDGKLVVVPKKEKKAYTTEEREWKNLLYMALNSRRDLTIGQLRGIFYDKMGRPLPEGIPFGDVAECNRTARIAARDIERAYALILKARSGSCSTTGVSEKTLSLLGR